jgi:hypothetical protein
MARGGQREGAGRPKVRATSWTARQPRLRATEGIMPKDFLLGIVRDETQPLDVRIEAAKAAAPILPREPGSDRAQRRDNDQARGRA